MANDEGKLTIRLEPETRRRVDQWYKADGCRSRSEFIEKAVNFYVSYLTVNDDNRFLPRAITVAMDGYLAGFKKAMTAALFENAVELDMVNTLLARAWSLSEEGLRKLRSDSSRNVKQTNGQISLEQKARQAVPDYDEDDYGWQG